MEGVHRKRFTTKRPINESLRGDGRASSPERRKGIHFLSATSFFTCDTLRASVEHQFQIDDRRLGHMPDVVEDKDERGEAECFDTEFKRTLCYPPPLTSLGLSH